MYTTLELGQLLLLSLFGSVFALVGATIFLYNKKLFKIFEANSIPFAAGVFISVAMLGLIPEAYEMIGRNTMYIVFVSFISAYFIEYFIINIHHHEHEQHDHVKSSSVFVVIGDTLHNLIDGIAIGSSFLINPGFGLVTAVSTFFHEIPHELGDFGILLDAKWKKRDIIIINIISALFTVLGAFSVLIFATNDTIVGTLLAISAGIFLYLGTLDFLPHATKGFSNHMKAAIPLFLGIAIMVLTFTLIPQS